MVYGSPSASSPLEVNAQDDVGLTALIIAAEYNSPEVVIRLIKAGAQINAKDKDGYTPLMHATSKSHNPEVVAAQYNRNLKDTAAYRQLQKASQ